MKTDDCPSLREPLMRDEKDGFFDEHTHTHTHGGPAPSLRQAPRRLLTKAAALARPHHACRLGKRFAYCFAPQLLRSYVWKEAAAKTKRFPTSYLNGLRGITSLKVFTFHYVFAFSDIGFAPWGTDDRHRRLLELPVIRYLYAGFTAHVFFGVAGYLTTLRLFQLMDRHDQASQSKVLVNVSGALFRRAFRLFLPVMIVTLITAHYIYFGWYEANRPYLLDHDTLFPGIWNEPKPEQFASYVDQMRYWAREMFELTNIFAPGSVYPYHDQHLWSILAEMKGSLFLYMILVATAQCHKYVRLAAMTVMTVMYFLWNHWEIWVYILGAIVAQLDLLLTEREDEKKMTLSPERLPPSPPRSPDSDRTPPLTQSLWTRMRRVDNPKGSRAVVRCLGFVVAFYLLSYPIDGAIHYAPGYMTLNKLIPEWMDRKDKFYPNLGTGLLIFLLARADPQTSVWRRILNSDVAQYLGKISFGLYLIHGPILHAVGYMIPHRIWWMFGVEGVDLPDLPWAAAIAVGWAFSLALSLAAADVWNREVESRCVSAVKKLEDLCFVRS